MLRRPFLLAAGAALAMLMGSDAFASAVLVNQLNVNAANQLIFTATSNGAGQVVFTINPNTGNVNVLNNSNVVSPAVNATIDPSITINFTTSYPFLTVTSTNPSPLTESLADASGTANLNYNLTSGLIADDFGLNLNGKITSTGATSNYDYSPLLGGSIQLSFNGSSFSNNVTKVSEFLATNGATWGGNINLSQSNTIPEPASMALLGIGLSGLLGLRRLMKRTSVA